MDKVLENLSDFEIILGSASPRRKELLAGLGIDFKVEVLKGIDESYPEHLQGAEIPLFIAKQKAQAYQSKLTPNQILITADTIVWANGQALGKPADREEAISELNVLSGATHQVHTGVCILSSHKQKYFTSTTDVSFSVLSPEEISYYVDKYKPMDKAGAYGIQEWIGYIGVEHLNGSFYNVMGLPIQALYQELKRF